jgi:hypothetical protein
MDSTELDDADRNFLEAYGALNAALDSSDWMSVEDLDCLNRARAGFASVDVGKITAEVRRLRSVEALLAELRPLVAESAEMTSYGFFPGGEFDPRNFTPDSENTPEELEAHRLAVEAWNRGERPTTKRGGRVENVTLPEHKNRATGEVVPERTGPAIVCGSSYGVGTIVYRDEEAAALLARIDAAVRART